MGIVEIKTKDRRVDPREDYEVSVPCNTYEYQVPDYYFAISLRRRGDIFDRLFFLGFISRVGYDEKKYLEVAGLKENGANFFCNTWNLKIRDLGECDNFPMGMMG